VSYLWSTSDHEAVYQKVTCRKEENNGKEFLLLLLLVLLQVVR